MRKAFYIITLTIFSFHSAIATRIETGADRLINNYHFLTGKRVGMVVNQTSIISATKTHLVDTLRSKGIDIRLLFAPEHGFRGVNDAGEEIKNSIDTKTQLPIVSLYGKNKKPTPDQLRQIDVLIYDIQDVGARFYTYTSTLFFVMQACAEEEKQLIVLDRPNPNDFVDGPVMQDSLRSFVGMLPIPILYGLTIGELAQMINGEGWLKAPQTCHLKVIEMRGWKHRQPYSLPVKPSPNLPNDLSVRLYPSLCLFEATPFSIGRGTKFPFQAIGFPDSTLGKFRFTPVSLPGFEKNPLQKDKTCYGIDLKNEKFAGGFTLKWIIRFYQQSKLGSGFFTHPRFFDQLCGNSNVRKLILEKKSESVIKKRWEKDIADYKKIRKKYLLYED